MQDKWSGLINHLSSQDTPLVVMSMDAIEAASGVRLPPYARNGQHYWRVLSRSLRAAGYRVSFKEVPEGHVGFERLVLATRRMGRKKASRANRKAGTSALVGLVDFLAAQEGPEIVLAFETIEELIGRPLSPSGRKHQAYWFDANRPWRKAGFKASFRKVPPGHVAFIREGRASEGRDSAAGQAVAPAATAWIARTVPQSAGDPAASDSVPDIILVGAGSRMADAPAAAKSFYLSEEFTRRRLHAEACGKPWFILSPLYGLLDPEHVVTPYRRDLERLDARSRWTWATRVVTSLVRLRGSLEGTRLEIQADGFVREQLESKLLARGAILVPPAPLETLRLPPVQVGLPSRSRPGKPSLGTRRRRPADAKVGREIGPRSAPAPASQTSPAVSPVWPDASWEPIPGRRLAARISLAFTRGELDLSGRPNSPPQGWDALPEVVVATVLRGEGMTDPDIRRMLTLGATIARATTLEVAWTSMLDLFLSHPWVFDPAEVARRRLLDLTGVLAEQHTAGAGWAEAAAWRTICESLVDSEHGAVVAKVLDTGEGDARELLRTLSARTFAGAARFPILGSPKVSPKWIRMLGHPGNAAISSLDALPLAVDGDIHRVSRCLSMAPVFDHFLDEAAHSIQRAWELDVKEGGTEGPESLRGTVAGLGPALSFMARWGCAHCDRRGIRMPVTEVCRTECRYEGSARV